jgi:hypothetical protein
MTRQVKTQYVNVQHALLTDAWTAAVRTLENGIRDFGTPPGFATDYQVSMFEMAGDPHLHVNVTHAHETKPVKGWAGPGVTAAGFVHNRTFDSASTDRILHDIRRMVFAPRA